MRLPTPEGLVHGVRGSAAATTLASVLLLSPLTPQHFSIALQPASATEQQMSGFGGKAMDGTSLLLADLDYQGSKVGQDTQITATKDFGAERPENSKIQGGGASTLQQGRRITITRGVNLDNTVWAGENLKGVAFQQSVVRSANFEKANLRTASFFDADISNSNFKDADMSECNLEMADLTK